MVVRSPSSRGCPVAPVSGTKANLALAGAGDRQKGRRLRARDGFLCFLELASLGALLWLICTLSRQSRGTAGPCDSRMSPWGVERDWGESTES